MLDLSNVRVEIRIWQLAISDGITVGWFIKKPANAKSLLVDKVLLLSLIENTKMYKTTFLGLLHNASGWLHMRQKIFFYLLWGQTCPTFLARGKVWGSSRPLGQPVELAEELCFFFLIHAHRRRFVKEPEKFQLHNFWVNES